MKLLCFGSCNIDLVYGVDNIVYPGETISAETLSTFPGGKGLNQAIALAKAGAAVYFAGCIGEDGQMLRDTLTAAGADLRYLQTVPGKTGHAIIQVERSGENCIIIFPGANGMVSKEHIDRVLADFGAGDFLLVQNEISQLAYLVEQAAARGMQVVYNPSPCNDTAKSVDLAAVRYLIVNETEALGMTGSQNPESIRQFIREKYPHLTVVMTLGKDGSVYCTPEQTVRQSAFLVDAVDTTAAGDSYTGYLIAGLSRGDSPQAAMALASAASAIAVSRMGASSSIPTEQEVLEVLQTLKPRSATGNPTQKHKAETWLRAHYADGALGDLADTLGFSATYTSSWLKTTFGASFTDLLADKKCEACATLLRTTDLPVSRIIQQVGYRNESFFRRKFTEKYGCSPLAYRKKAE